MSEKLRRLVETSRTPEEARRRTRTVLRESINGEHLLVSIADILETLVKGEEEPASAPPGLPAEKVPLDGARVSALRTALDGHFKLLNKVLPDLKSVELTGSDGGPVQLETVERSRTELAARLLYYLHQSGTTLEGEVVEPADERSYDFLE